jgi:hypothetical protein
MQGCGTTRGRARWDGPATVTQSGSQALAPHAGHVDPQRLDAPLGARPPVGRLEVGGGRHEQRAAVVSAEHARERHLPHRMPFQRAPRLTRTTSRP